MSNRNRARAGALLAPFVAGAALLPSAGAEPVPPTVTTDCRVRISQAELADDAPVIDRATGEVRPGDERPFGFGTVVVQLRDGRAVVLDADTLLCRRDGGGVPAHGGANIADFTGPALLLGHGAADRQLTFQAHVEDRGAGNETDDYLAVRVVDAGGAEVLFDANYLIAGDIELIPVAPA